jgi:matrixin
MLLSTILIFSINSVKLSFSYDEYYGESQFRYIGTNENNDSPQDLDLLEICCSWSNAIADGILTYALIETVEVDESTKHAVEDAVKEWDSNIEGLELREVEQSSPAPDLQITFDNLRSIEKGNREYNFKNDIDDQLTVIPTAGWTQFRFTNQGLIDNAKITISDDVLNFGFNIGIIEQIAKHEMGHALGLGHSYDEERLMADIVIEERTENISECEINGVLQANQWKLLNAKSIPGPPMRGYIIC